MLELFCFKDDSLASVLDYEDTTKVLVRVGCVQVKLYAESGVAVGCGVCDWPDTFLVHFESRRVDDYFHCHRT